MKHHFNITIYGEVKGVDFRTTARSIAEGLGVTGFAKNNAGDCVYIEAEGEEESLNKFLEWCHQGPPQAKVERVETTAGDLQNFEDFKVIHYV